MSDEEKMSPVNGDQTSGVDDDRAAGQVPVGIVGGDVVEGDKITVDEVEGQSAVAVGRGARASVFNIDIRLLPLVIGLVLLVATLAYFLLRPDPVPDMMDAEFNVAVAEFMVEDEAGNQVKSEEGLKFGNWLYGRVDKGLDEVLAELFDGTHLVWPPEYTGLVSGSTRAEREANAAARAQEIGADVIIYGALTPAGDKSWTGIEFFVNHDSFEEGQDVVGGHSLGSALPIDNPFEEALVGAENVPLSARAQGLSLVAVGLAYYSVDDFESAINYFEQADNVDKWVDLAETGKHVVKLLLGNAYLRQASQDKEPLLLPTAQSYYAEALALDNQYARAVAGLASIDYVLALGDIDDPESGIDVQLLDRAQKGFEKALTLENIPENANLQSKVDLGLGQVYIARFAVEGGDWKEKSVEKFEKVINDFEGGNDQIADLASHAYARMSTIEKLFNKDRDQAISYGQLAVEHASPFYKGEYAARLGDLYVATCRLDEARDTYLEARAAALQSADKDQVAEFSQKLDSLDQIVCEE